ncbi:VIP peptides protein [Microtus ochrogaster]|uniref:VIP peptides protein n=1 Tax=Microtus ochrogaster TaxID=79684 RepID=A0A8J6GEQ1_MICOH|nr:VIP peptides protein [Microtus ochrogaster]
MEARSKPQFLALLMVFSVLSSQSLAWPLFGPPSAGRNTRHADGVFTSDYSRLLGQISAKKYLESLIGKRISSNIAEDPVPIKRHSDAVFTDNYTRLRKQMAVKKYLNSIMNGKRRRYVPNSKLGGLAIRNNERRDERVSWFGNSDILTPKPQGVTKKMRLKL